jgi:tetratricopeptide (TPR) repeat protein
VKKIFTYRLLGFAVVCMFMLQSQVSFAQWELEISARLKKEETNDRMEGVKVTIKRNGTVWKTLETDANGSFGALLPSDAIYMVVFSKPGHVTKKIEFSTKFVPPEDAKYGLDFAGFEVTLFEEIDDLDVSILDNPIAKIAFDPAIGYMDFDQAYTKTIKKELDRLKQELADRLEAEAEKRKLKQKSYDEAIDAADKAYNSGEWTAAKPHYEKALTIFPKESYPITQLDDISAKLAAAEGATKKYNAAIAKADAALKAKDYDQALVAYQNASNVKSDEQYPKDQLKAVNSILADAKKVDKEYNDVITAGNQSMLSKDYVDAKEKFNKALELKGYEKIPKDKLVEIASILAEQGAKEKGYTDAITAADAALGAKEYDKAITAYQKALGLKPTETYPQEKIVEAKRLKGEKNQLEENYKTFISSADAAMGIKDYATAKSNYEQAAALKATETYPQQKIEEIKGLMGASAKLDTDYADYIKKGDQLVAAKKYEEAKGTFDAALKLKSAEQYPKDQLKLIGAALAEIARLKAEKEASNMADAEKEAKYKAAIAAGDNSFNSKDYAAAKLNYNKAIAIQPGEQYPKDQLTAIEAALASSAKNADEALAAESARKKREYFDAIIAEAESELTAKNYKEATTKFTQALGVIPGEKYPTAKIKEIADLLANIESDKVNTNLAKEKIDQEYKALIASADQKISSKNYNAAKSDYKSALLLKPVEAYPKKQLAEIERLLAKENEISLTANAQNQKNKDYNKFIKDAEAHFSSKNYKRAISSYNQALSIMPKEALPKNKIAEIEKIVADLAKKEKGNKATLLAEKEKRAKYDQLIFNGNRSVKLEDYSKAKSIFSDALALYSTEKYPQDKLVEIEARLKKQNQPKEVLVSKGTVSGGRAKINKDKENEIEAMMSSLLAKKDIKKDEKLQNDKSDYNKQEEIRISGGIERRIEAKDELTTREEGNLAIIARGDQFHKENDEALQATIELLNKAEETRIKKAAKKRSQAKDELTTREEGNLAIIARGDQFHKENDEALQATIELLNKAEETRVEKATKKRNQAKVELTTREEGNLAIIARGDQFHKENDEALQATIELLNKAEETRVEKATKKRNQAKVELTTREEGNLAIIARGDQFHKENDEALQATVELLTEAEETRIKKADEKRNEADIELKVYNEQQEAFIKEQNELSTEKVEAHHIYVDNIQEREFVMIEKGDGLRAKNRAIISEVVKNDAENRADNRKKAEEKVLDVKQYKEELAKKEEVLVSASIDRTQANTENIKAVSEELTAMKKEKVNHYKLNVVELTDFKKRIETLEANTIEKADVLRVENQKINAEYVTNIQKEGVKQDQKYYEDLVDINTYKKEVGKAELKKQKAADQQRTLANEEVLKAMERLNAVDPDQEKRYAAFKTKLEAEKERNANFSADLQTIEQRRLSEANMELKGFYMGEKRVSKDSELASKYPQGITEETVESGNSVVIRRTKVTDNHADVYERVFYAWGASYFYKNGKNITQSLWDKESIEE